MTDYALTAIHAPGGRLPKPLDDYPNGIGGKTTYGVVRQVSGRREELLFTSDSMAEATRVLAEYRTGKR